MAEDNRPPRPPRPTHIPTRYPSENLNAPKTPPGLSERAEPTPELPWTPYICPTCTSLCMDLEVHNSFWHPVVVSE